MGRRSSMSITVVGFTLGMILTKLSSFLLNIALSYKFGASYYSDSIIIAMNIPVVLFGGFISAVAISYIPIFKEEEVNHGDTNTLTSLYINIFTICLILVCAVIYCFPKASVSIFANGMGEEGIAIAATITKYVAIASVFNLATGILQGFLQANSRFTLVSVASLPVNIIIALSVFLSTQESVTYLVGLGLITAYYVQFLLFVFASKKSGYKYKLTFNYRDDRIKLLLKMIMPVLMSTLIYELNTIIDKNFASFLPAGNISVLDYSYKVAGAAQGILAYPITTILYTKLSTSASKKDIDGINNTVESGCVHLGIIMIPTLTGMLCTSKYIVKLIFGRGAFSEASINATSLCLILYLFGMYAISYRALFEKAFYSLKTTKIVLLNTVITVLTNVILDFLLYKPFQSAGLAIATSGSLIISCVFLFLQLCRSTKITLRKESKVSILKIIFSSIIMAFVIICIKTLLISSRIQTLLQFLILIVVGITVYVLCLLALKESTVKVLLKDIAGRVVVK